MYEDEDEDGPRGSFDIYRAEGDTLFKNGDYKKAIDSFTTALELRQDDKDCLVARSRCYLQLGDTEQALKDAETSLKGEPSYHKGLYQKAEALYCKGEFELALVFYHRGHKMRPELHEFRLGIQKAQEAIDNSVGSPEKVKLTKKGDLSFFDELTEQHTKKGRTKANYIARPITTTTKQTQMEYKSSSSDKTVKQLLGELYGDRVYLEKLLKETDSKSRLGQNIHNLVCDGLKYLDTRTEFWRQQKPMYARKRKPISHGQSNFKYDKVAFNQYIHRQLEKIDEEIFDGKYQESLQRAKNCKMTVEGYGNGVLKNKEEIISNLHSLMGNAFMEMGFLEKALHHHKTDMNMAKSHKLKDAKSRALDNLGRVYARGGEYQKAVKIWQEKIPMVKTAIEFTWLYHEMGRCYLEMGQFDKAKDFGEKSAVKAVKAGDVMWQLNASVLVAQAQAKLQELEGSLSSFEKALDLAKLQGDLSAEAALMKAIQDVNNKIVQKLLKEEAEQGPKTLSQSPSAPNQPQTLSPTPEPKTLSPTPEPQTLSPAPNTVTNP